MTTDPKALIERNADYLNPGDLIVGPHMLIHALEETDQALRDLTAENERLTEQRDFLGAQAADLALKVGRLKALGDGLAEAMRLSEQLFGSAALAAWETK